MNVKLLSEQHLECLSLKGAYESTLVKMPHCWKSHAMAQLLLSAPYSRFKTKVDTLCAHRVHLKCACFTITIKQFCKPLDLNTCMRING